MKKLPYFEQTEKGLVAPYCEDFLAIDYQGSICLNRLNLPKGNRNVSFCRPDLCPILKDYQREVSLSVRTAERR